MKKIICILLCSILLITFPIKGYASSAVFFGMSEEVVLAFIASLLGIQAKEAITSYDELVDYNDSLKYGLTEYIAGSATSMQLAEWIGKAVIGNIDTSSIIWQKFYDFCISNYVVAQSSSVNVPADNTLGVREFSYQPISIFERISTGVSYPCEACINYGVESNHSQVSIPCSSINESYMTNQYTRDGKTVYYTYISATGNDRWSYTPPIVDSALYNYFKSYVNGRMYAAWLAIYGGYSAPIDNVGISSNAFSGVLNSIDKENLIDGTSVLQLYNPAAAQNGLHIVPDPEDPDDIVIPAMLTADWYNFLQQFGSGAQQFVAAYNALNAAEGVSTGAINGLYNKLGIASAVNSAAAAAQGTLTLTDNNIFPMVSTVSDAVNGVIPGVLTPVAPDNGINNDSDQGLYKLPDLRDFFPFCIPFDLIDLLSCFVAEPETPEFVIALSDGNNLAEHEITLESFNNIASIVRTLELAVFILGLMLITRNLIRG